MAVIDLVRPAKNEKLLAELRSMIEAAEKGEIVGMAGVKLRPDNRFGTFRVGECSDLELAGALSFAQHDLIGGNSAKKGE